MEDEIDQYKKLKDNYFLENRNYDYESQFLKYMSMDTKEYNKEYELCI